MNNDSPVPRKRGRPPRKETAAPKKTTAKAAKNVPQPLQLADFGVPEVTAHRPVSLLEVQDSADLDVLLLDSKLAPHLLTRLSPTVALLAKGSEKAVLDALRKAGHTPKVVEA